MLASVIVISIPKSYISVPTVSDLTWNYKVVLGTFIQQ